MSNVTGNNARFVKDLGLGVGAKVVVKRSGMVIPIIADVITSVEFVQPTIEGVEVDWNEAGIELITLTETDDQKLKKIVAFFEILEADNVSEGVITQLWDAGYKTIKDVLNLTTSDLEKIDRFGKRKADIVYKSIQKSVSNVQLSKLQHATGIFKGLGSKKLVLLEDFKTKPTIDQVMSIEGFAEVSAQSYIDSYDTFFEFIKDLPVTIVEKVEAKVSIFNQLAEVNHSEAIFATNTSSLSISAIPVLSPNIAFVSNICPSLSSNNPNNLGLTAVNVSTNCRIALALIAFVLVSAEIVLLLRSDLKTKVRSTASNPSNPDCFASLM